MVGATLVMPTVFTTRARGQAGETARKIFVVVQLFGGNDGLHTT